MDVSEPSQALFFGITLRDVVTAMLVPVVAACTTLIVQERQQVRERRMQILRMLLATRHLPADPAFNAAINLITVEFNKTPAVIKAWSDYIQQSRYEPTAENQATHSEEMLRKQTKLITAVMKKLRMSYSEADIQADAYISRGFVNRDNLFIDSLKATRDAAEAMKGVETTMKFQSRLLYEQLYGKPPEKDQP